MFCENVILKNKGNKEQRNRTILVSGDMAGDERKGMFQCQSSSKLYRKSVKIKASQLHKICSHRLFYFGKHD